MFQHSDAFRCFKVPGDSSLPHFAVRLNDLANLEEALEGQKGAPSRQEEGALSRFSGNFSGRLPLRQEPTEIA